jgi:exodeoxyribonuclease VII large subunit
MNRFTHESATSKPGRFIGSGTQTPAAGVSKTIGIVTSPQAAALRDVLTTLRRRVPHVQVILYPTPVQGEGAGAKMAQA